MAFSVWRVSFFCEKVGVGRGKGGEGFWWLFWGEGVWGIGYCRVQGLLSGPAKENRHRNAKRVTTPGLAPSQRRDGAKGPAASLGFDRTLL